MSATTSVTVTSASPVPTAGGCHNLYVIPTQDAACAMPFGGNNTDIMSKCCKDANVISYYDDCGLYCLAIGQNVGNLTSCLHENGAGDRDVFCGGEVNATATETGPGDVPETASARVVASGSSDSDDDDNSNGSNGGGNGNGNSDNSDGDDDSAATQARPVFSVLGFTVGALLVSATAFGALSI